MNPIRPRKVTHTGSVLVSGLAIDTQLVPEPVARQRIASLLPGGSDIFQFGFILISRFRAPLRMPAQSALGTPLVRYGKLLSACPLAADEQAALEAHEEAIVLVSGGVASASGLDDTTRVDISLWLDVSEFAVFPALRPLGSIELEPRAQLTAVSPDLRRSLGVAPMNADTIRLLRALQERSTAADAKPAKAGSRAWMAALTAAVARFASRAFSRSRAGPKTTKAAASRPSQALASPPRPSIGSRLRGYLARALWSSQIGHMLGRQYGRYFSRLLDMFDGNDLENALRNAIALDAKLGVGPGRLPLWTPSARKDLSIGTKEQAAGATLGLGDDLYNMLRERYRRAFQRLETLGEIEKAAFVLAELLNATEEAVAFLERHKRFRLAAEIAESRNLAPGLVIRLWFLSGEGERAIRIARQTGAFADAVLRLDVSHKREAQLLRLVWAHTLAQSGQYTAAADVAWPIEEARNLAFAWMDKAIEIGGAGGAKMLARKLRTRPSEFAELRPRVLQFLRDDDGGSENFIKIFGQELLATPPLTDEARLIARATARRMLPGIRDKEGERFVKELVDASGDAILRADVRGGALVETKGRPESRTQLAQRAEPINFWRAEADRGTIAVSDAAELPDGKMLIAVGELGVLLLSRQGQTITRFSEPANHIVMSDNGDRAILLAQRGETFRLARLDLLTKRLRPWCDARFDLFAPDFDGGTWFVARGGTLYAIDALADRWAHFWKVDESAATITSIRRNAGSMGAFFKWKDRFAESWTYEYPSLILRKRRQINQGDGQFTAECVSASGDFAGWRLFNAVFAAYLNVESGWITLPLTASDDTKAHSLTDEWIVQSSSDKRVSTVYVLDRQHLQVRARVQLEGPDLHIAARIQDGRLVLCDNRGRVMVIDLATGTLIREHRVS